MKNIIFWVAFLGTIATIWGQEKQYIILEGTIGKYPISLQLFADPWNSTEDSTVLSGYYYYASQEIPIGVFEKNKKGSHLELNTWDYEGDDKELFLGSLTSSSYKGTWTKGNKSLEFDLKMVSTKERGDFTKLESSIQIPYTNTKLGEMGEGYFNFGFLVPQDTDIQKELLSKAYPEYTGERFYFKEILEDMEASYLDEMKSMENEGYGGNMNRQFSEYLRPIMNSPNYLIMMQSGYEYTGGAHGMSYASYFTYDKRKKRWLEIDDVLDVSKATEINKVLDKTLRKEYGIPENIKLNEADESIFLAESIQFSTSFTLSKNGIKFYYGLYDMTPYSYGFFELFVSYDDLKPFLKKGFTY